MKSPIAERMLAQDAFSQWLGIEIIDQRPGYCKIGMTIRPEMLNGMGKAHGGITFSFADSCFGFATNAHGRKAVSIEASVNHLRALDAGDCITAETSLDEAMNKLGFHLIEVKRGEELVALFKGVVYRTSQKWQ
ncbi:thioesterase [Lewinellaceae bacterium SD302]|nr:thioesterase [Lewinellaceae bacterium SD302]